MEAYCIRCKKKTEVVNGKQDFMKNGTPIIKGVCGVCGANVNRILSKAERPQSEVPPEVKGTPEIDAPYDGPDIDEGQDSD